MGDRYAAMGRNEVRHRRGVLMLWDLFDARNFAYFLFSDKRHCMIEMIDEIETIRCYDQVKCFHSRVDLIGSRTTSVNHAEASVRISKSPTVSTVHTHFLHQSPRM